MSNLSKLKNNISKSLDLSSFDLYCFLIDKYEAKKD